MSDEQRMVWHLWNSAFPSYLHAPAAPDVSPAEFTLLASLLDHGASAACLIDRQGRLLEATPNLASIASLAPEHWSAEMRAFAKPLASGCGRATAPQKKRAAHGPKMLEWTFLPSHDAEGRAVALVRDVSAEHQALAREKKAVTAAKIAEKNRQDFLANMSHELRTPLNAVLGFTQMIDQQIFGKLGNATYRSYIRRIQESGQELLGKINELLHIASLDAEAAPRSVKISVNAMLRDAVESYTHQAFRKDITLKPVLLDPSPVVMGDAHELKQALMHVLSNAVKYGAEGSQVQIVCRALRDGSLKLQIADRGPGMSAALLEQVQAGLERPLMERGRDDLGLGLAVAKHYLDRHGVRLAITSREGYGTQVEFAFPADMTSWDVAPAGKRTALAG